MADVDVDSIYFGIFAGDMRNANKAKEHLFKVCT